MKINLNEETQEFIAKTICDLGKAILTVGFASYFFEKLSLFLRIGFVILGLSSILISVIIIANKGDK